MEKTNESSRMTSIARRISMDFWLKQFSDFLLIDLLIAGLVVMTFFFWREGLVPEGQIAADRYFQGEDLAGLQYVIETDSGGVYSCYIRDTLEMLRVPAIILLVCEGLILTGRLFGTGRVRRRMKPLYDIAVRTEQLSSQPFDSGKFESMEKAISSLDPDLPGARITTGDKDLLSLEIAINNMLERMRESHRQQERFVSDASHELRTPVSVIQGYVNMLDRWGKEDEKILEEGIEAIKNESEHMKNLIEQLLFLARGDGGRNTLHMTEFDLTEMVRDVWEESSMIDQTHPYVFQGDRPVMVTGDTAMLKQSLRILVQNASKYSRPGDTVSMGTCLADGAAACFVQDEGIGMGDSEVIHVFERFYRSDAARNSAEGGTGLGLSIAKWIVDAHRGEIRVLSRPGLGTRFTIKLPREQDDIRQK